MTRPAGEVMGRLSWPGGIRRRPTVAVIDLDAIRHNLRTLRPPDAEVMAVVKAGGYGHGDVPVARAALEAGASWLGVALVEEGIRLRDARLQAPILVLAEFPPGSEKEALAAGLTPSLYSREGLGRLAEAAASLGLPVAVHVKVDTGMHRVGLPRDEVGDFLRAVQRAGLQVEGLWTHFAKSEDVDDPFTEVQLGRFKVATAVAAAAGIRPRYLHAANTAALMAHPASRLNMVRLGLGLYGLSPGPGLPGANTLRPAMSWKSEVAMVKTVPAGEGISYGLQYAPERDSSIATVPVGYADGYSRLLSGKAEVLIRGRRHRVAGAITMDQLMVDCGQQDVEPEDEVVLMGTQGDDSIGADEVAAWMGTISYEVVCAVSERVPREYVDSG